ncbi:helix-turn-helix transcriptional regulator [Aestuariivirga sp. YIM B02566]|uniref:Helix-turn-helix transcriptional regulator n=1 Tax=Taklimakanibacter albus TaxID=2800327 RepID=A0ACC5QYF0_9HYPH|nr:helix-turn-helix transcriptional regulator [Aestuariivirga sp. YIM B02566]MBK1865382.1 helix-turn-helix transcriptional regulator [Aestuariivirga sp. YIM B02566]
MGKLGISDAGAAAQALGQIAGALGTPRFHRGILDVVREVFPSDFAQVYQIERDGRAVCIDPCDTPEIHCKSYVREFSRYCPLSRHWQNTGRPGVVTMNEVRERDYDFGNYFAEFYDPIGLVDEIGMLLPSPGRRTVALFMERSMRFSDEAPDVLRRLYSGIARLHRTNNQLLFRGAVTRAARGFQPNAVCIFDRAGETVFANRQWRQACRHDGALEAQARAAFAEGSRSLDIDGGTLFASRLDEWFPIAPGGRLCVLSYSSLRNSLPALKASFLAGYVSKREHEIICAILEGYPTKAIAERVGCAPQTVKAHKKRIYRRLDITTEREIFLMFLDHLQGRSPVLDASKVV